MLQVIRSNQRGHANHGWLNTYHTFSFADYYNPDMMGFRSLRVINEDRVTPGQGFGTHGHANMEILSYVVEGAIAHKDSTGGEEILRPHEWQRNDGWQRDQAQRIQSVENGPSAFLSNLDFAGKRRFGAWLRAKDVCARRQKRKAETRRLK